MEHLLSIVQVGLAIALTIIVLVQRANPDSGGALSQDAFGSHIIEKRGSEKTLHNATIYIAVLFVLAQLAEFVFH